MKPAKRFDCVRMKWDIQQRLAEEIEHLQPGEARAALRRRVEQDTEFAAWLKQVDEHGKAERPARD